VGVLIELRLLDGEMEHRRIRVLGLLRTCEIFERRDDERPLESVPLPTQIGDVARFAGAQGDVRRRDRQLRRAWFDHDVGRGYVLPHLLGQTLTELFERGTVGGLHDLGVAGEHLLLQIDKTLVCLGALFGDRLKELLEDRPPLLDRLGGRVSHGGDKHELVAVGQSSLADALESEKVPRVSLDWVASIGILHLPGQQLLFDRVDRRRLSESELGVGLPVLPVDPPLRVSCRRSDRLEVGISAAPTGDGLLSVVPGST
jgi:hypothetical protein